MAVGLRQRPPGETRHLQVLAAAPRTRLLQLAPQQLRRQTGGGALEPLEQPGRDAGQRRRQRGRAMAEHVVDLAHHADDAAPVRGLPMVGALAQQRNLERRVQERTREQVAARELARGVQRVGGELSDLDLHGRGF